MPSDVTLAPEERLQFDQLLKIRWRAIEIVSDRTSDPEVIRLAIKVADDFVDHCSDNLDQIQLHPDDTNLFAMVILKEHVAVVERRLRYAMKELPFWIRWLLPFVPEHRVHRKLKSLISSL